MAKNKRPDFWCHLKPSNLQNKFPLTFRNNCKRYKTWISVTKTFSSDRCAYHTAQKTDRLKGTYSASWYLKTSHVKCLTARQTQVMFNLRYRSCLTWRKFPVTYSTPITPETAAVNVSSLTTTEERDESSRSKNTVTTQGACMCCCCCCGCCKAGMW